MAGVETKDRLYEAVVGTCDDDAYIADGKEVADWHSRMEHCSNDTLTSTIRLVRGIADYRIEATYSKCKSCLFGNSARAARTSRKVAEVSPT